MRTQGGAGPDPLRLASQSIIRRDLSMNAKRTAFTLVEILIVVVIMAVLAATIIPQFTASTKYAQESTAVLNLQALRSQIELYKAQHGGSPPSTLDKLTASLTSRGTTGTDPP